MLDAAGKELVLEMIGQEIAMQQLAGSAQAQQLEPPQHVPGMRGVLCGLERRPELNGRLGTLGSLDEESGRWEITFEDGEGGIRVRPENVVQPEDVDGGSEVWVEEEPEPRVVDRAELKRRQERAWKEKKEIEIRAKKEMERRFMEETPCPNGHILVSFAVDPGFPCDMCKRDSKRGDTMWGCRARNDRGARACDFDVCSECKVTEAKRRIKAETKRRKREEEERKIREWKERKAQERLEQSMGTGCAPSKGGC